jgi:hypothetical protein
MSNEDFKIACDALKLSKDAAGDRASSAIDEEADESDKPDGGW